MLPTQYSLPCLCTLNQAPLCDVRLETGALSRAGLVPSPVTHISVSLSHLAPTSIVPLPGPKAMVEFQPPPGDRNSPLDNCSFGSTKLWICVGLFDSLGQSTEPSPAAPPAPGPGCLAAPTWPQVVSVAVVSFCQCKEGQRLLVPNVSSKQFLLSNHFFHIQDLPGITY